MRRLLSIAAFLLISIASFAGTPKIKMSCGPWIQNVTEDSFTVLWTTEVSTLSWIEVFPDDGTPYNACERQQYWQTVSGRRMSGTFHSIKVTGLKPGTSYRYRVCGKEVLDDSNAYDIRYGRTGALKQIFSVRTLDASAPLCRFAMVNDMHYDDAKYTALMNGIDASNNDFVVLNGDIVSYAGKIDTLIVHTFGPIAAQAASMPVFFARGNHEGRGAEWYKAPSVFPTPTGEFYYTFRQGPVAFVVLDAGEDKPDSDVEYFGQAQYDDYRQAELEWLKTAVKEESFASAPVKVCLVHIPTFCDKKAWYSQRWIAEHFTPVLNEAGVDLMLSGHHHRYIFVEKGEYGNNFPIIANSNVERLDFVSDGNEIRINFFDRDGKKTREQVFNKNSR